MINIAERLSVHPCGIFISISTPTTTTATMATAMTTTSMTTMRDGRIKL